MWIDARDEQPPKRDPIVIRTDACLTVAIWRDEWSGWVAMADGFDAHDSKGDVIVIDKPHYWFRVPDLEAE